MKELLEHILKNLVTSPEDIVVDEQVLADGLTILSITANPDDYGRIIGRQGMLIQALRTIVKARAIKEKKKVMVRVMTDDVKDAPAQSAKSTPETEATNQSVAPESLDDNVV
jgi:predicted RNA-binding protein YlqC (UPF0109 family)